MARQKATAGPGWARLPRTGLRAARPQRCRRAFAFLLPDAKRRKTATPTQYQVHPYGPCARTPFQRSARGVVAALQLLHHQDHQATTTAIVPTKESTFEDWLGMNHLACVRTASPHSSGITCAGLQRAATTVQQPRLIRAHSKHCHVWGRTVHRSIHFKAVLGKGCASGSARQRSCHMVGLLPLPGASWKTGDPGTVVALHLASL